MRFPIILLALACAATTPADDLPNGLYAIFNTAQGQITARLYEKYTPIAVENFVGLAQGTKAWLDPKTHKMVKRPMYDNITFHRIITGEMIQSGDPSGIGLDCGSTIRDEFLPGLRFDNPGRLAVANTGQPDSGSCQFFFTAGPVPTWNNHYTVFGEVVSGQKVVTQISHARVHGDKPIDPPKLLSVTIQRIGPAPTLKEKRK